MCAFVIFAMYLTRTAGIETQSSAKSTPEEEMYLTRTAGIETSIDDA